MYTRLSFLLCLGLVLAGCSGDTTGETSGDTESSSSSSVAISVTRNVTYEGTVEELGITIFQQGTHRLSLDDGNFIILESGDPELDLEQYIGKRVEVRGDAQPTVEAGGTIMTVGTVTLLEEDDSSSSSSAQFCGGIAAFPCAEGFTCVDDPSDDCDPMNGGADCGGICVTETSSSSESSSVTSVSTSSSSPSSQSSASSSSQSSVSSAASSSSSMSHLSSSEAKIELMSKQDYSDSTQWTQKYCTGHIGFCIPAHRNWFYKSFGTTTSFLWHVEFDMAAIENLGDGPIALNLLSGAAPQDGAIVEEGSLVKGYKNWTENRHFEVVADARLRAAVEHLLASIEAFTPTEE